MIEPCERCEAEVEDAHRCRSCGEETSLWECKKYNGLCKYDIND